MKVPTASGVDLSSAKRALPMTASGNEIRLSEIQHRGVLFRLKESIVVPYFCEGGLVYCEYKPLSILSFGSTLDAAIRSFQEDFAMMWDVIAKSSDKSLAPEAKKVKISLKALVDKVVSE